MKLPTVEKWITILANIGVFAGLILVAVEIRQNTEITKAQILNDYHLADMQLELKMMGDTPHLSWTRAVYSPDELLKEDLAALDRYFNYGLIQISRLKDMQIYGLVDEETLNKMTQYLDWHLGNQVGRRWWAHLREEEDKSFVEIVDKILERSDPGRNQKFLDAMLPPIKSQVDGVDH